MNLTEILNAQGITEEVVKAILAAMKENKIYTASEENLDIRFGKMKTENEGMKQQLQQSQSTIAELQKMTKGQEQAQQQIADYQNRMTQLQQELEQTKINAAIKVELLSSKAVDVDYLTFKLNEKLKADGETLTLDDNGSIKGWNDKLAGLKTQFPTMFEASSGDDGGYQIVNPNVLKKGDGGETPPTKESFRAMSYEQRVALKQKNETLYKELAK